MREQGASRVRRLSPAAALFVLGAVLPLMFAVPALSENSATTNPDQVICKSRPKAGSRHVERTCHTRAEWDQIIEAARRTGSEMADRDAINRSSMEVHRNCSNPSNIC